MCTMVCDNQEIKVLLLGGSSGREAVSDCWLLDVNRGIGDRVRNKADGEMQLELMVSH